MKIFLDTANLDDISFYRDFIDGVTTNPSLMSLHNKKDYESVIEKICSIIHGPISVEVNSDTFDEMVKEGKQIASLHENICVKLPCTFDGLRAGKVLSSAGISTNLTLCFSSPQAIMAAKSGATFVSPFIGRLDDIGSDGLLLIEEIKGIYEAQEFETKILAASVRNIQHLIQVATIGVDAVTLPPKILKQCFEHPLTVNGLNIFKKDWEKNKK